MGIASDIGRIKLASPTTLGYLVVIIAATLEALRQILSKALLVPSDQISTELNPITVSFFIFIINGFFLHRLLEKAAQLKKLEKKTCSL